MQKTTLQNVLTLYTPDQDALPVVFDSPHSGAQYPTDFDYSCALSTLRSIEDRYVDELFLEAANHGATLIAAEFPRSYIDVNRASDDIDETLIDGEWPHKEHGKASPTKRSDAGIGLIPRLIKPGTPIYNRSLSPKEIMNRVKNYYEPYHDTLCTTLDEAFYNHGHVFHINCHSMPSSSAYPKQIHAIPMKPSDIVLGDQDGRSCNKEFLHLLRDFWRGLGYRVTINDPFKGVELISAYAQPTRGKNSIQIEINRSLYMDEETGEKSKDFEKIKGQCSAMIKTCTDYVRANPERIAAD